jgi:hypothetical protein
MIDFEIFKTHKLVSHLNIRTLNRMNTFVGNLNHTTIYI